MSEKKEDWLTLPERGTVFGMYFLASTATLFGRWLPRLFLWPIAFYYHLFSKSTYKASVDFQTKVRKRPPTRREVFRNILYFAQVALDRVFFSIGRSDDFEVKKVGTHHLEKLAAEKKGAILLGAHLGSFSAMRSKGKEKFKINAIVYGANSRIINGVLKKFGANNLKTIDISKDRINGLLKIKERVQNGEIAALLIDRVLPGAPSVEVEFLGQRTKISSGAFAMAAMFNCPIYLVFGLYRGGNQYEIFCEPFSDEIVLPRGPAKQLVLAELGQKYADRLAFYCEKAPDNWFNFFEFWPKNEIRNDDEMHQEGS